MSVSLEKWVEAAVTVADAENMKDEEVVPTWPEFCVERFPDLYPQMTVGALREFWAALSHRGEPEAWLATSKNKGWKLVPIELTRDMRMAFHEAHELFEDGEEVEGSPDDEWRAMLDAAPQPPVEHRNAELQESSK